MIARGLIRQSHCLRNRIRGNTAAPFLHDGFPSGAASHLLHDVCYQDSRASERGLAMANGGVADYVPADHPLHLIALGHSRAPQKQLYGGPVQTRTADLFRVKEAL